MTSLFYNDYSLIHQVDRTEAEGEVGPVQPISNSLYFCIIDGSKAVLLIRFSMLPVFSFFIVFTYFVSG